MLDQNGRILVACISLVTTVVMWRMLCSMDPPGNDMKKKWIHAGMAGVGGFLVHSALIGM